MVAIVAGSGLGLFNATPNILGAAVLGQSSLGQAAVRCFVNVATGNLILQAGDEHLSGRGLGLSHLRTHNSLGAQNDGDGDGWRWDGERVVVLQGSIGGSGSTVTRTGGDGHQTVYSWDGSRYSSTEGGGAYDGLVHEADPQQWVWTDGSSRLVERYSASTGKLTSQQDLSGNTIAYQYDSGRLTAVTDLASGQKLVLTYEPLPGRPDLTRLKRVDTVALTVDSTGRATDVVGTPVKQVDYSYDPVGRLASVRTELTPTDTSDTSFYITDYTYDGSSSNRVARIEQSDGSIVDFTYELGKVKSVKDVRGTQTFTYKAPAPGKLETDIASEIGNGATPQTWTFVCDGTHRLTEIKTPPPTPGGARLSTRYEYHPDGSVRRIIDAEGNGSEYEYDTQGNRRLERDPLGNTIIRTFDQRNQVVTETRYGIPDPDGADPQAAGNPVTTRFAYDTQARLRFTISAEGVVSENRYGTSGPATGLLTQTLVYTGGRIDVSGRTPQESLTEAELIAWVGGRDKTQVELTEFAYDLRGNLSKETAFAKTTAAGVGVLDAAAEVTEYIYDAHGDLLKTVVGRGAGRTRRTIVSSVVRDGLGRVTQSADASGTNTTAYDDDNSKIQLTTAVGLVDSRSFDNRGRLVGVTRSGDGTSRQGKNVYDAAGRLRMSEDPQGGRRFIFYDAADRVRFTIDSTGAVTGLEHDATGQVTAETQYRNVVNTSSWYDGATVTKNFLTLGASGADLVVDADHDRVTRYAYDPSNRRTTVTDAVGTVSTTAYDGRSLVTQQRTGDRVSRFFYDRDDRQVGVVDPLGFLTEYKYDPAGRLSETILYSKRSPAAANVAPPVWVGVTNLTATGGRLFEHHLPAFDADGDDLVYSKVGTWPSWLELFTSTGSAVLRGTPPTTVGSYSLVVKADDQRTKSANATVTITVVNTPPTWTTLPNSTVPRGKTGYSLILPAATDIESPAGQLVYSLRSPLPAGLTFTAADRRISGTPTAAGVSTLTARVTDSQGLFTEQSFALTVTNNGPTWAPMPTQPALLHVPFTRPDGSPVTVPPATDPDEQPLTYSVVAKPAWMQFNPTTRVLSGIPTALGPVSVQLRAEDSIGRTVTLTFDVDVTFPVVGINGAANRPPTSVKATRILMTAGSLLSYPLTPSADPEGGRLNYSAVSGLPEGLSVNSSTGVITGTTTVVGRHQVVVRATDLGGASADRVVTLEVKKATPRSVAPVGTEPVEDVLAAWRPTDTSGLRSHLFYDGQGSVVGSVDERGFLTETVYNAETNTRQELRYRNSVTVTPTDTLATLKVKAGSGKVTTTVELDDLGRVSRLIATDGTVTQNEYDDAGRLIREVHAIGSGEQRSGRSRLNAFGEATGVLGGEGDAALPVDPTQPAIDAAIAGRGMRYEYDKRGRRAKAVDPENHATLFFYDGEDRLTHSINAEREIVETKYDSNGQVTSARRYANRITPQNLAILTGGPADQLAGKLPAVDSGKDQLTTFEYDRRGLLTKQTDAEGFITSRTYNQFGQLETETRTISTGSGGTRSVTTRSDYDLRGGLLSRTADVGGISLNQRTSYDGQGRPVRSVDGAGHATGTAYLDGGRTIEVTDPLGRTTRLEHDTFGRILRRVDPSGQAIRYEYDDSTRAEAVTSPENVRVTTRKTRHGEVAEVTDGVGGITKYQYNKDGQLLTVIDAAGAKIRENIYDDSGRLETTGDGRGMVVRLFYDAADRVRERKVESDNNVTTAYQFDAFGQTTTVTEGKGTAAELVTSYVYDRNGRPVQVVVDPSGLKLSTKYSYDGLGNAVTIQHGTVDSPAQQVTTYEFDNLGRKTKQIDAPSAVLGIGEPGTRDLTTQYRYDAVGRLSRVIDVNGNSAWTVYDAAGQVTHVINAEGEVNQNTYDLNGRLIKTRRYLNRLSAATLASLGDVAGPLVPAVDAKDQRSILVYDKDGRLRFSLTAAQEDGWTIGESRYDANGNIIEVRRYDKFLPEARIAALEAASSLGFSVGQVNAELTALGYGGEDSLTQIQRTRYAYHANNRLRFTVDAHGAVTENVYDPMGALVSTVLYAVKPTLSSYTQNAINAAVNRTDPGNRTTHFAYDAQGRLRFTLRVAASDSQGKATQHLVSEQAYDALGRPSQSTQYATPVGAVADYKPATIATAVVAHADDRRQASVYDTAGRQIYSVRVLTPGAVGKHQVTKTEYDAVGRVTQRTAYAVEMGLASFAKATVDAAVAAHKTNKDRTTSFVYDILGRQRFVVAADGSLSETMYDPLGRPEEKRRFHLIIDAATPRTEAALVQRRGSRAMGDGATRGERYTYDRVGRLLTITDAKGLTETNIYNGLGDRTSHTDKNGAVCTYVYDRLGRVSRKINPAATVFVQLTGQTQPALQTVGLEDRTQYDPFGNLDKTVERINTVDARTTDFSYDTLGRLKTTALPGYFADPTAPDADPLLVGRVHKANAAGRFRRTVVLTYDVFGKVVRTETRTGVSTSQFEYKTYDRLGRVKHDVDALHHVVAFTYTSFDEQKDVTRHGVTITDTPPNGSHWTATEIATKLGSDPQARTITTMYDNAGRKREVKQPAVSYYHGDRAQRKNAPQAPLVTDHATTLYRYSAFDQVRHEAVKLDATRWQNTWRYFDTMGREVRSIDTLNHHTTKTYDPLGNLSRVVEYEVPGQPGSDNLNEPGVNDSERDRIAAFTYNTLDQRTSVRRLGARYSELDNNDYVQVNNGRDVASTLQSFTYDGLGKVLTQTDGLGTVTSFGYNALGQLDRITEPARPTAAPASVDPFRNPATATPMTALTLDGFGDVVKQTRAAGGGAGGTLVVQQAYDAAGNLTATTDARGNINRRQVDYAGRVVKEIQPVNVAQAGEFVYSYNLERRYAYDASGRQTHTLDVFAEGTQTTQSGMHSMFNPFGEVAEERRVWGPAAMAPKDLSKAAVAIYSYDKAGHVFERTNADGKVRFRYNLAGQVTRQEELGKKPDPVQAVIRLTETGYDDLGRRVIQRLPSFTALVDSAPTPVTPLVMQDYDRWGNVTSRVEGRSVRHSNNVLLGQASTTGFEYNADNQVTIQRLPRTSTPSSTVDLRHELRHDLIGRVVEEVDISHVVGTPEDIFKVVRRRSRKYDSVGQVVSETDGTLITTRYSYDAHGNRVGVRNALGTVHVDTFDQNGNVKTRGVLRRSAVDEYDGSDGQTPTLFVFNDYTYDQANRRIGSGEMEKKDASGSFVRTFTKLDERGYARINLNFGIRTTCDYDVLGNKTLEKDANNQARTWVYDTAPDPVDPVLAAQHIFTFGRLQSTTVGGNRTTGYKYDDFGALQKEDYPTASFTNSFRERDYHENGLLKQVREILVKGTPGAAGEDDYWQSEETTLYDYTALGQPAKENFTRTGQHDVKRFVSIQLGWVYEQQPLSPIGRTTLTTYDALGRISNVASTPANTSDPANRRGAVTLTYQYDELSNRRKVSTTFTRPGSTTPEPPLDLWHDYDAEGRMTVVDGILGEGGITAGTKGTTISYDAVGRRQTAEKFVKNRPGTTSSGWPIQWSDFREEGYHYNDRNFLERVSQRINKRQYKAGSSNVPPAEIPANGSSPWKTSEIRDVDGRGAVLSSGVFKVIESNGYRPIDVTDPQLETTIVRTYGSRGQLTFQSTTHHTGQIPNSSSNQYGYDSAGVLRSYHYHQSKLPGVDSSLAFNNLYTYEYLEEFGGYKEKKITVTSDLPNLKNGDTTSKFDPSGRLLGQSSSLGGSVSRTRTFSYDIDDHVLTKDEATVDSASNGPNTSGKQDFTYTQGLLVSVVGSGALEIAQFTNVFTPISAAYPAPNLSGHVVSAGDTLAAIAQLYFGDSSLWHLIADANSVAQAPTDPLPDTETGKTYRIPNVVGNVHNNANTFMPYNIGNIIGDATPYPRPLPPPPPALWKRILVQAVTMIVAAGVTIAMTYALGPGAGAAAVSGGVGQAAGNLAGQLLAKELGLQDDIKAGPVLAAGIAGFIGGAVGGFAPNNVYGRLAQAHANYFGRHLANNIAEQPMSQSGSYLWDYAFGLASATWSPYVDRPYFKWSGPLNDLVGSALDPQTGWYRRDPSRDWRTLVEQALAASIRVVIGAGAAWTRKQVLPIEEPEKNYEGLSFNESVIAAFGLEAGPDSRITNSKFVYLGAGSSRYFLLVGRGDYFNQLVYNAQVIGLNPGKGIVMDEHGNLNLGEPNGPSAAWYLMQRKIAAIAEAGQDAQIREAAGGELPEPIMMHGEAPGGPIRLPGGAVMRPGPPRNRLDALDREDLRGWVQTHPHGEIHMNGAYDRGQGGFAAYGYESRGGYYYETADGERQWRYHEDPNLDGWGTPRGIIMGMDAGANPYDKTRNNYYITTPDGLNSRRERLRNEAILGAHNAAINGGAGGFLGGVLGGVISVAFGGEAVDGYTSGVQWGRHLNAFGGTAASAKALKDATAVGSYRPQVLPSPYLAASTTRVVNPTPGQVNPTPGPVSLSLVPTQSPFGGPSLSGRGQGQEGGNSMSAPAMRGPFTGLDKSFYARTDGRYAALIRIGRAFGFDKITNMYQVADTVEMLAGKGYKTIHLATARHGLESGRLGKQEYSFYLQDLATANDAMRRYPGLNIILYDMNVRSEALLFRTVQNSAANGRLKNEVTLAGLCFGANRLPQRDRRRGGD